MMSVTLCGEHPEEKLRFVCVPCDTLICRDCKLTEHEGHKSIDIAKATTGVKDKLDEHRSRLQQRLGLLESVRRELEQDMTAASEAQLQLERQVKARAAKVIAWVKDAEEAALIALKGIAIKVDSTLSASSSDLDKRQTEVNEMLASMDSALTSLSSPDSSPAALDTAAILRLEQDMRVGRGKGENLERLTEALPNYCVRPTLMRDSGQMSEALIRGFLGTPLYSQLSMTEPKVALSLCFRCPAAVPEVSVNAVCPVPGGGVWVAHDLEAGDSSQQVVTLHTEEGRELRSQKVSGRVSIARAHGDWVYVLGSGVKKIMNGEETREAITDKDPGPQRKARSLPRLGQHTQCALSKLHTRFSVKAKGEEQSEESLICKVEARALPSLWVITESVFSVQAGRPLALDVDSTGSYFAVLVPDPALKLFRVSETQPAAVYNPFNEHFSPSDVCFHWLEGREVLLVADWLNSAIHVLSFKDSGNLKFLYYLGAGCPLLTQPTALTSDPQHRLWIGCKGGHVLTCMEATSLEEAEQEQSLDIKI